MDRSIPQPVSHPGTIEPCCVQQPPVPASRSRIRANSLGTGPWLQTNRSLTLITFWDGHRSFLVLGMLVGIFLGYLLLYSCWFSWLFFVFQYGIVAHYLKNGPGMHTADFEICWSAVLHIRCLRACCPKLIQNVQSTTTRRSWETRFWRENHPALRSIVGLTAAAPIFWHTALPMSMRSASSVEIETLQSALYLEHWTCLCRHISDPKKNVEHMQFTIFYNVHQCSVCHCVPMIVHNYM